MPIAFGTHETIAGLKGFAWQAGEYAACAVSVYELPDVKQYIAAQAEHHRVCARFRRSSLAFLTAAQFGVLREIHLGLGTVRACVLRCRDL